MASKCYCLNVFYIFFFILTFTGETLSDSDTHFIPYETDLPSHSSHFTFVPLGRTIRQVPADKKNDPAQGEKSKITKKPTAMDAKPTNIPADGDQKSKTGSNKKESLSTKIIATTPPADVIHTQEDDNDKEMEHGHTDETLTTTKNDMDIGIAGIMGILFVICLALGVGLWLFYGYRNPHTPAGQFLIRYRPSQWSWRRGEARYTAATIHM